MISPLSKGVITPMGVSNGPTTESMKLLNKTNNTYYPSNIFTLQKFTPYN
jgi:hypothetical protein